MYQGWPHLLYSGFDCDVNALMDTERIRGFLNDIPGRIGMSLLGPPVIYEVTPEKHPDIGVTGIAVITTSHLSIHTFPYGQEPGSKKGIKDSFFTFDCYSCQMFEPEVVCEELERLFHPSWVEKEVVYRLKRDIPLSRRMDYPITRSLYA